MILKIVVTTTVIPVYQYSPSININVTCKCTLEFQWQYISQLCVKVRKMTVYKQSAVLSICYPYTKYNANKVMHIFNGGHSTNY